MHETVREPSSRHTVALELQALARQAREALLTVLATENPPTALAELDRAVAALARIDDLASQHDFVDLPMLDDVRGSVDRLACELYHQGACDGLDEKARTAFIDRHARGLTALEGIGTATARRLFVHGISNLEQLRALDPAALDEVEGLGSAILARIKANL
ncbi:helix-hairpin-helix domain-containing protein [Halomonas sp. LBP4]|uniref:helix-hairpin-helix domain-containing protein n=1 Tax=Halomonas sp. LBP4 TaxID=2044917 RepID=UPI000D76D486|nr:helix-hairpin-helix domain-containing protein [Halomonas sp. LBP4]PXX95605.1 hypothetical protein CR157_18275 [Halomonas sp. LBP4]